MMDNRRQFYRINDTISLSYKVVQTGDNEQEINAAKRGYAELAEIRNAIYCIDARMDDISQQLSQDFPLISELVGLFNKKIALHDRMMGYDEDDNRLMSVAKEVNLSANGVAFEAETPMAEGSYLRLEMVIFPENYYIPVYARVVNCRQNNEDSPSGYTIAVEFDAISEKDQEKIMHHILKKQADDIKKQRDSEELGTGKTSKQSVG